MVTRSRHLTLLALGTFCASVAGAACGSLEVPDLNNPSNESLTQTPTRSGVLAAATGLLVGHRAGVSGANGYVSMMGVLGRESYVLDPADPRFVTEMLVAPQLDPGSAVFGGNFWAAPYANIRNANTLLAALDGVAGMTDAEREATRGFAKTIQALDFLVIVNTRDTNGGPIDVSRPVNQTLAPIATKDELFAHIGQLLDDAKTHLAAGGATFPFPLSSGFAGFNTPAKFLQVNRAIQARVAVYRGRFAEALTALGESFISDTASLNLGAHHAFGAGSGDVTNTLNAPTIYAHPSVLADAEKKVDLTLDNRVVAKLKKVTSRTVQELTSDQGFAAYTSTTSSIPIIRNEELILLRAEANIGLGNVAAAATDLNLIRVQSGGLAARGDLDATNILDELLKQRRYSLLFEGGHRWIDARRHGKLATLPKDKPTHTVHERYPLPVAETDARK